MKFASIRAVGEASFSIIGRSRLRCFSVSCLESLSRSFLKLGGKITAAAVTGPAKHPRPASSVPASTIAIGECCRFIRAML